VSEREVPNHWLGHCFGCSTTNPHGLHLRFWYSERGCFTKCTIPDYLCGIDGIVHGGILALLLDEVAEWTVVAHLSRFGMTRNISIQYFKPARTNTEITVESQIISYDDKNAVQRSTIHLADGTLVAESRSEWLLPKLSTIASLTSVNEATLQEFLTKYPRKEESVEQ
jgi:acyl-CoA thioesterase FadM